MTNYIDKSERITEGCSQVLLMRSLQNGESQLLQLRYHANGELIINEAETKVVRWIFERYLAGDSLGKIASGLQKPKAAV